MVEDWSSQFQGQIEQDRRDLQGESLDRSTEDRYLHLYRQSYPYYELLARSTDPGTISKQQTGEITTITSDHRVKGSALQTNLDLQHKARSTPSKAATKGSKPAQPKGTQGEHKSKQQGTDRS